MPPTGALTNGVPRGPSIAVSASPLFREQAVRAYMRGELSERPFASSRQA
jgi:hypothetical protein